MLDALRHVLEAEPGVAYALLSSGPALVERRTRVATPTSPSN